METKTKCPWCDQGYTVLSILTDQVVTCPKCDKKFTVRPCESDSSEPDSFPPLNSFASQQQKETPTASDAVKYRHISSTHPALPSSYDKDKMWKGIKDFFGFKIMIIPIFAKILFFLAFVGGSVWLLTMPYRMIGINDLSQNLRLVFAYFVIFVFGIPIFAILLHALFELILLLFSILDTLVEIRNRLGGEGR